MASFTSRQDLEQLITPRRVIELFDDDGDGAVTGTDLDSLNEAIAEANDFTEAQVIKKGWTHDELDGIAGDRALRRAATQVLAQIAGERKPGFFNGDGDGFFQAMGVRGRAYLKELARGESRSRLEAAHGGHRTIRGKLSASTPVSIFGREPGDPEDKYGDGKGF